MTTYTIYKGTELVTSFEVEDGAPQARQPMDIERVAIMSASIGEQAFNSSSKRSEFMDLMANAGVDNFLSINTTYANGGDESQDYLNKLDAMLSDAAGFERLLFIVHGFGNDVSRYGPWPGGADQYESAMRTITERIQQAGHMVAWTSTTYRLPGFSNPTAPYNARINIPVIRELMPQFMDGDRPWFDLYQLTYDHQPFIESDGIHPTDRGQALIRGYVARRVADLINPAVPATIDDFLGKTVIFTTGDQLHKQYGQGVNGFVANTETGGDANAVQGYGHCLKVYDTDGQPLNGVTMFTEHGNASSGGSSSGSDEMNLTNQLVVREYIFSSTNVDGRVVIDGLPDGLTGTMTIVAVRAAADSRKGDYTYNGETVTLEGAWQSGQPFQQASWPFVINNGRIVLDWKVSQGSDWAYLNGIMLEFDT